jgi:hypothetical protein
MATDSVLKSCLSALKTALAAANGAGSYHYDLSGTDQVKIGIVFPPIAPIPQIQIGPRIAGDSEYGRTMGHYMRQDIRIPFMGFAATTAATEEARLFAGSNLLSDITRAAEASREPGNVEDIIIRNWEVWGAEVEGNPGLAVVIGEFEVHYKVTTGA